MVAVFVDGRVSSCYKRPRWWCILWFYLQTRRNWSHCHCNWCAHIFRKGCPPCWFNQSSWSFPKGKDTKHDKHCLFFLLLIICHFKLAPVFHSVIVMMLKCCAILQVLTAIGNFCICSIAVGMLVEIVVMYPIQHRAYRPGIDNMLVLLIGGIPIAMPTVLSVTMAIGSHRLAQQVGFP